ncbi:hypothetical protein [Motiliproteus sediminis]|uniref:hypothetical protein n=1 Tax=Motiliproteus sediminis TaxID=1468178 RepID=UPI001AF00127|nr:hypothetical protein [Motiliproteus sediminis]
MEFLIVWKVLVSIAAVVGLSLVAEHVSPRVAGILSGYPLGSAIALFFIGVEQGAAFAAEAASHTLAGFSASLALAGCYWLGSRSVARGHLPAAAVAGVAGFLAVSALLNSLPLALVSGGVLTVLVIVLCTFWFRGIPNAVVGTRVRFSHGVLLFRALMAAATVLLITGLAEWIGPAWAGLLSAFPITLFPFMLIIHYSYGKPQVYTVIRNYPVGLWALAIYAVTVHFAYASVGVGWGTLLGFAAATIYLVGLSLFYSWRQRQEARANAAG